MIKYRYRISRYGYCNINTFRLVIRKDSHGTVRMVLDSSMVEHTAVNRGVVGSSPTQGVDGKAGSSSIRKLYSRPDPRGFRKRK